MTDNKHVGEGAWPARWRWYLGPAASAPGENGRAISVRFAQEGARVVAVDKRPESLPETLELAGAFRANIETRICDVEDSAQVAHLVDMVVQRHRRIDILVNNVGGPYPAARRRCLKPIGSGSSA